MSTMSHINSIIREAESIEDAVTKTLGIVSHGSWTDDDRAEFRRWIHEQWDAVRAEDEEEDRIPSPADLRAEGVLPTPRPISGPIQRQRGRGGYWSSGGFSG